LEGAIVQEYCYHVLGFVSAEVVQVKKDVWFRKISNEQITAVEKFIKSRNSFCARMAR
jgi:hypothetical protein